MHKDTREALERLEAQLLADEQVPEMDDDELDDLLEEFLSEEDEAPRSRSPYQNYANGYQVYNSDRVDVDLDEYSDEVYEEPKENLTGLLVTASVLLAAIAGVLIYWVVRIL